MHGPFLAAIVGFGLLNVAGLALARTWRRFVLFYLLSVAVYVGIAAVTVLVAEPGIPDSWAGHADVFGHEIELTQSYALILSMYWLVLLGISAAVVATVNRVGRTSWWKRLDGRLVEIFGEPPEWQ